MNAIIPNIETLKQVVKINAALPPEAISPYIDDALEIYIEPQVGEEIIKKALTGEDEDLNKKMLRCLGPLTLMLATPELGIRIGDSGITVDNEQGKRSPANEAKIAAAKESFCYRGMQALDRLLAYLSQHAETYPEYIKYATTTTEAIPCFIRNAQEYQDVGMVNIDYSTISYRIMLPTIRQLQVQNVEEMLRPELYETLLKAYRSKDMNAIQIVLVAHIIRYLANKTAELYTSQSSATQCATNGNQVFKPIIRPIYQDMTDTGNFFANQANYYAAKIKEYIFENATALGITLPEKAIDFNTKEKHIFASIS